MEACYADPRRAAGAFKGQPTFDRLGMPYPGAASHLPILSDASNRLHGQVAHVQVRSKAKRVQVPLLTPNESPPQSASSGVGFFVSYPSRTQSERRIRP